MCASAITSENPNRNRDNKECICLNKECIGHNPIPIEGGGESTHSHINRLQTRGCKIFDEFILQCDISCVR